MPDRPNIIWLIADDLGDGDLGCYGHPTIRTENLDRIAGQGVRFTSAFVTTSSCSPSRASTFTGRYPHATGAEDLHVPIPEGIPLLPSFLKDLGYYSAIAGKFHMGEKAASQFDRVESEVGAWRKVLPEIPDGKPFFLTVAFYDPHRSYQTDTLPDPADPGSMVVPPYLPDSEMVRGDLAMYCDEVTRLDRETGELDKWLSDHGLADNTVIVFFSDNGMPFPRAKTTCYDSGCRTPLIVRWPDRFPAGTVCDELFSLVDLAPSMLGLVGESGADGMQGLDQSALFRDPSTAGAREYVHLQTNWHDLDDHVRAVRDKRFKYIRNYFPRQMLTVPLDALDSPSYKSLLAERDAGCLTREQMRLFMAPRAAEELFDTAADPWEFTDLHAVDHYRGHLERMAAECDRWLAETGGDVDPNRRRMDLMDVYSGEVRREILGGPGPYRDE
ncbi:MAG: sulfatase [Candidatus Glassbacteria bacterium]|nr:sulfatase [Candidatus Glassbacteria bacterium]